MATELTKAEVENYFSHLGFSDEDADECKDPIGALVGIDDDDEVKMLLEAVNEHRKAAGRPTIVTDVTVDDFRATSNTAAASPGTTRVAGTPAAAGAPVAGGAAAAVPPTVAGSPATGAAPAAPTPGTPPGTPPVVLAPGVIQPSFFRKAWGVISWPFRKGWTLVVLLAVGGAGLFMRALRAFGGGFNRHRTPILKVGGALALLALIVWGCVAWGPGLYATAAGVFSGDDSAEVAATPPSPKKAASKLPTGGGDNGQATIPAGNQRLVMSCINAAGALHSCVEPAGCQDMKYRPSAHVYFDCPGGRWQSHLPPSDYPSGQIGIPLLWIPK